VIDMEINIKLTSKKQKIVDGVPSYNGKITIGDFAETIVVPVDLWKKEDYERQWQEGLARIKTHDTSCLVTFIYDPHIRPLLEWWILYRVNNIVCVQNLMFSDFVYQEIIGDKPFTPDTCYDFIPPRVIEFEDGSRPSEWRIPLEER
jgi:hypothetical protein